MDSGPLYKAPRSNFWHLVTIPLSSAVGLGILVPLLAAGGLISSTPSITGWRLGDVLCGLSVLFVIVYLLAAGSVKRAVLFYSLLALGALPAAVGMLVIGLSITSRLLDQGDFVLIASGLLVGMGTMPVNLQSRRKWLRREIDHGMLRRSLDQEAGRWDKGYDDLRPKVNLRSGGTGCLMPLLPWVGPAIGMSLADIVGRANANVIIGLLAIAVGYFVMVDVAVRHGAQVLELRRLEKELGRPILMVEDDNPQNT